MNKITYVVRLDIEVTVDFNAENSEVELDDAKAVLIDLINSADEEEHGITCKVLPDENSTFVETFIGN